jgi:eukaryotic-like serine/threonine-protein kinase
VTACPICRIEYDDDRLRYCSRCGSDIRARPSSEGADAWIGQVVDGRYKVQARIGTGGMGAVYRVEHVRMGKIAAMKVLHRELAGDEQVMKRFQREVEVVSRLNHPNIVQTFDFGYWEGLLYLIMEFVKGEDLGAMVKREGPLTTQRALGMAVQVCSALDEAHHLGVVHRDLKPENVVCVRRRDEEHAKVLDFGLAKLRERPELGEITGAGNLVGTPYFMSPEQVRSEVVDQRTDIYSLGATLYRVLTGCFPFEGNSPMGIMSKHLTDRLIPPSERTPNLRLSTEVDRVVMRAMARKRDDRYASAADMRHELEGLLGVASGERLPVSALRPPGPAMDEVLPLEELASDSTEAGIRLEREDIDAFERQQRRRRVASLMVAIVLLGGLGLAGWATVRFVRPRPVTVEKEPNDVPSLATTLPQGRPVSGHVGSPRTSGEPDFDYYRVPAGPGTRAVTATVTGVPEVDLVLELYDDTGQRLAKVDNTGAGKDESLGPVAIGQGEAFVRVRPVWTAGEPAGAASPTPYELTVEWGPPRPDVELEPNDTPLTANKIEREGSLTGHLSSAEDEDWFVIKVPPGMRVDGEVQGIDGVDLAVLVGEHRKRIDSAGLGDDESFQASPGKDGLVLVGIAEQPPRKSAKRSAPKPDRSDPYHLKVKFRPDR